MLNITRFDAGACGFPPALVPVRAGMQAAPLAWAGAPPRPAAAAGASRYWHYQRGRYALHQAYRLAGLRPGTSLLAPAYHCRTMLDPAITLGADILLYPVDADLRPDLPAIAGLMQQAAEAGHAVRAVLVTHYFGMPQPRAVMEAVSDLAQAGHAELIEDCSHALVLDPSLAPPMQLGGGIGTAARLGISSPYKFLPSQDGGLLWASPALLASRTPSVRRPSLAAELRAGARLLREWCQPEVAAPAAGLPAWQPGPQPPADAEAPSTGPSADYHPADQDLGSLASTRLLMRRTRLDVLATRRRQRYQQWCAAVAGLAGCRALMPDLPAGTIPYMFPLLLDAPWPHFHQLKHSGLPIWRWDQMAASACQVAGTYRLALLHLPCHQGLTDQQMDWLTSTLRSVLRQAAKHTATGPAA